MERLEEDAHGDLIYLIWIRRQTEWLSARGKVDCTAHSIQAYQTENERNSMLAF
jgi:hypothetical protein